MGDSIYAWEASGDGPLLSVFDAVTGTKQYSTVGLLGLIQQVSPFVGPDGTIYAPRTQNNATVDYLIAYDDTGSEFEEKWRVPLGYIPFASFGVGPDGSIYSYQTQPIDDDIQLTLIRLDPTDGTILDQSVPFLTNLPAMPRMAIDRTGIIYFTNGGFSLGEVFSFNPDLSLRWSELVFRVNVGGPAIGQNGVMVICVVGTDVRAYQTERPSQMWYFRQFEPIP